ncbi:hypothetical protein [Laedolimicola sp.]|uniref:hypothetical protein n=1 Tax=Laedolimicola sp. TaxID=2981663 RepID=UPI003F7D7C4C
MEKNDGRKTICRREYNFNRRNEKNKKETGSHTERICGFAGLLQKDSGTLGKRTCKRTGCLAYEASGA